MTVLSKFAEPAHIEPTNNYYYFKRCWHNALYNLMTSPEHAPADDKPLHRLVAGSLETADGHGIWGVEGLKNPQAFLDDWGACHVWVEDGEGRIWDLLSEEYNDVVSKRLKMSNKTSSVATHITAGGIEIEGMTSLEIERAYGFRFVPAPAHCQGHILSHCFKKWMPFRPYNFHTGKHFSEGWIGFGYKAITMARQMEKTALFQRIHNFFEAIIGSDREAQIWWRTEVWGKPADTKYFHYHTNDMGEDMLTGAGFDSMVEDFINKDICGDALKEYMNKSINAYNDEPDWSDVLEVISRHADGVTTNVTGFTVTEIQLD
jgi:hypothetical protein